jgi:hypothetical protein
LFGPYFFEEFLFASRFYPPAQPNRLFYTVKTIEKLFEPKQGRKRDSPDFHVPGRGPGKCPEKHFEKARRRLKAMKARLAEEKKREKRS